MTTYYDLCTTTGGLIREWAYKKKSTEILRLLEYACKNHYYDAVRYILGSGIIMSSELLDTYIIERIVGYAIRCNHIVLLEIIIPYLADYYIWYTLLRASRDDNSEVVNLVLRLYPGNLRNCNRALINASARGYTSIVLWMLIDGRLDPSAHDSESLREAVRNHHTQVVGLLLEDGRVDPSAKNSQALRIAAKSGYTDIVGLLLEDCRVDPRANNSQAFRSACNHNHLEIARMLITKSDKRANNYEVKRTAIVRKNVEVLRMLSE